MPCASEIQEILPRRDNASVSTSDFETLRNTVPFGDPPNPRSTDGTKPTLRKPISNPSPASQV